MRRRCCAENARSQRLARTRCAFASRRCGRWRRAWARGTSTRKRCSARYCARRDTRGACLHDARGIYASRSRHETRADAPSPPRRPLPPSPSPFRRDEVTGELTGWPRDVAVSPGPEARPSASPTRGAACAPVDLTSPDDAARRDDDDATREQEARGDATPRDGPDPISALRPSLTSLTPHKVWFQNARNRRWCRSPSRIPKTALPPRKTRRNADAAPKTTTTSPRRGARRKTFVSFVVQLAFGPPPRAPRSHARAGAAERGLAKHGMKPGPREYMRASSRAWTRARRYRRTFSEPERSVGAEGGGGGAVASTLSDGGRSDGGSDDSLENALGRFIKSNVALYERVLLMGGGRGRGGDCAARAGAARAEHRRREGSRTKLLAYLEREGVAVTHVRGRGRRRHERGFSL